VSSRTIATTVTACMLKMTSTSPTISPLTSAFAGSHSFPGTKSMAASNNSEPQTTTPALNPPTSVEVAVLIFDRKIRSGGSELVRRSRPSYGLYPYKAGEISVVAGELGWSPLLIRNANRLHSADVTVEPEERFDTGLDKERLRNHGQIGDFWSVPIASVRSSSLGVESSFPWIGPPMQTESGQLDTGMNLRDLLADDLFSQQANKPREANRESIALRRLSRVFC
jgi:hypothetical protein